VSPSDEFDSEIAPVAPVARPAMRPAPSLWWQRLVAITFGFLGVFLGLLLWHLYADHVAMHQMIQYINLQAPKINQLPAPTP